MTATQAPTPGPLSATAAFVKAFGQSLDQDFAFWSSSATSSVRGALYPLWKAASEEVRLAPTAPVEASGSERDFGDSIIDCEIAREAFDSRPQPSGETRWTEDMERERREADYERGFRDGQNSGPQPSGETREAVARIIDPSAFLFSPDELPKGSRAQFDAFDRADRILALPLGGQHSSGEGE